MSERFYSINKKLIYIFIGVVVSISLLTISVIFVFNVYFPSFDKTKKIEITRLVDSNLSPIIQKYDVGLYLHKSDCKVLGIWKQGSLKVYDNENQNCFESSIGRPFSDLFKAKKTQKFDVETERLFNEISQASVFYTHLNNINFKIEVYEFDLIDTNLNSDNNDVNITKNLGSYSILYDNGIHQDSLGYFKKTNNSTLQEGSVRFEKIDNNWYEIRAYR